jgi:hypothetical protein
MMKRRFHKKSSNHSIFEEPDGSSQFRGSDESETFIRIRIVRQNYEEEKNSQSSSKVEEEKISKEIFEPLSIRRT